MKLPEIPITATDLVLGVLCPALVATAVWGLASLTPFRRREWAGPVATAAGFLVGYPLINGAMPAFPPNNAGDWIFWFAAPIALATGVVSSVRLPLTARSVIAMIVLGAALCFMMQPARASRSAADWWTLWMALTAVLTIDFWVATAAIQHDTTSTSLIGFLGILAAACVLIQMSGSFKYALQGGAWVSAGVAGAGLVALGLPRSLVADGLPLVGLGIVGCFLAVSIEPLFVNVTIVNATLIAAAPILLWASRFIRMPTSPWWFRAAVRLMLPAIPVLIALGIAGAKAMADLNRTGVDDYYGY